MFNEYKSRGVYQEWYVKGDMSRVEKQVKSDSQELQIKNDVSIQGLHVKCELFIVTYQE